MVDNENDVTLLTSSSAQALPAAVQRPGFDRAALATGIVHLGLGAFHRAHQALYTEAALAAGDRRWGIVGVHLRGRRLADALRAQDHLYTVTEQHGEQQTTRLVGAVRAALFAPAQLRTVLGALADPAVHIISSTVTEKGYSLQPATGALDLGDPELAHDLDEPAQPARAKVLFTGVHAGEERRSTLGVLAAGLLRRDPRHPVTVVCCDNMAANGPTLQRLLAAYAERACPALLPRLRDFRAPFASGAVDE